MCQMLIKFYLYCVPEIAQALRDMSVSLDKVGKVYRALNRLEEAEAASAESAELRRRLSEM